MVANAIGVDESIRVSHRTVLVILTALSVISGTRSAHCPSQHEARHILMAQIEKAGEELFSQYVDNPQSRLIDTYLDHGWQLFEPNSYEGN